MAHLLHIDSSPRSFSQTPAPHQSITRMLTNEFVTTWKTANPGSTVTYRDLGHNPVPPLDEQAIAAAFTPPEARTPELAAAIQTSDALVDEFLAADIYVFGVPMYNFNVPSAFKAYIDQIVRVNRTFAIDANGYKGLVSGKKMIVITARGGSFRPGTQAADYDFQEPYLRTIFGFIGITDIQFIHADNQQGGEDARTRSLVEAHAAIEQLTAA